MLCFASTQQQVHRSGTTECPILSAIDAPGFDGDARRMILREATPTDAEALAALGRNAFIAAFAHLYRPEDLRAFLLHNHVPTQAAAEIADPLYRIALATDAEGLLLGFCKLVMTCGWPEHARAGRTIELKQLYTDPTVTGQGIGTALMAWAMAQATASGAGEIQLSVWSGNVGAQRFYARYGFEEIAGIHFYVGEQRDDEFLYSRLM